MDFITPWITPALLVALFAWLRLDMREQRREVREEIRGLNKRFDEVSKRFDQVQHELGDLRERMAKLEGSLDGFLAGRRDRDVA